MNDFLHRFLQVIAETLTISRQVLYDYDELANTFDLLYFQGHPADARASLRRRMRELDLERALERRDPYAVAGADRELLVPLYFMDTLEAVLLIELETPTAEDDPELRSAFQLVRRMLGLFMSSSRLPVNERQKAAANPLERAREVQLSYLSNGSVRPCSSTGSAHCGRSPAAFSASRNASARNPSRTTISRCS